MKGRTGHGTTQAVSSESRQMDRVRWSEAASEVEGSCQVLQQLNFGALVWKGGSITAKHSQHAAILLFWLLCQPPGAAMGLHESMITRARLIN